MIGDSLEADIVGALEQGMQAIHFNSHGEKEHELCPIVYSLDELKAMF
jgi:putative hydrolase of the HAD superfamily